MNLFKYKIMSKKVDEQFSMQINATNDDSSKYSCIVPVAEFL